jgi:hypothetical protein
MTHIAPSNLKTWHCFALLIAVATLVHYRLHYIILLIAAVVLLVRGYLWLCVRYPRTMFFVSAFLSSLLGRRRRRW